MDKSFSASSRAAIEPFHVMEVMRAAEERLAAGNEVLHLEVGQPSTGAAAGVLEAAHRAIDSDVLGYTTAKGLPELRARISDHYLGWYGVEVDPERVLVTMGASGGFVLAFLAAFDPGGRVAVPSPGYPCYRNALTALGVEVIDLPVDRSTRFQPTPNLLERLLPLDGLVLASPSNPTGTMLPEPELEALVEWCDANSVRLICDEIYHGITYDQAAPSALEYGDSVVVVNSFSKYFSMTGWRLGWVVSPEDLVVPIERLAQNFTIAAPTLSQTAAVAAFDCHDELELNVRRYAENRRILLDGLPGAGFTDLAPADGAFYIWAGSSHMGIGSEELCRRWLDEIGVAATPGVDFDPGRGQGFVRFSFAGSQGDVAEAVVRLKDWVSQNTGVTDK